MNAKTLVLTGGASGIGRGILDYAVRSDWRCGVIDLPGPELEALQSAYSRESVVTSAADITDEGDVEAAVTEIVNSLGVPDGVINCAGIGQNLSIEETSVEQFRRILDVNVIGSFIVTRQAIRHMNRGAIVNITSVSGLRGSVGRVAYGSSKGAVNTMTEIMAVELAPRGIRVNAIAPGPVETPMTMKWHDEKTRNDWVSRVPLGRYGNIEEIAAMAITLVEDRSSYVNGQIIAVDGGFAAAGLMGHS